ncbi:iron-siderophore ABC transporter substrate-binding protein [Brucella pseudogrignonensis]|uniref:iron-siderophore ABC transporter substrate-binding protein n=1 Tax=Brucella pseudogrignonensis TaxID=419475 RepID=UPI001E2E8D0B|nr:iron-siderophore ABC transporter substrate-binding protein [Brucella pseudogrignonensis]MCD4514375.1 iron-siderophore ABC transporter substrate-binding protein [Brucella pseudogrignonensis]
MELHQSLFGQNTDHHRRGRISRNLLFSFVVCVALVGILPAASSSYAAATKSFPVTIEHALGTTVVPVKPKRIVTLGWGNEDVAVALGIVPVGMPYRRFFASGIFPWVEEKLGGHRPELLSSEMVDLESIALLRPDLILALRSGITSKEYRHLSRLAPTIAYPDAPWKTPWRRQTEIIGIALGEQEAARKLINQTDEVVQGLAAKYGNLRGRTFTFSMFSLSGGGIGVYFPTEPRVDILTQLGLVPSAGVKALADAHPSRAGSGVSWELANSIEADVLAMWVNPGGTEAVMEQPLLQNMDVVRRGSLVLFDDPVSMWASSIPSALSIPYALPQIAARLSDAVKNTGR